MIKDSGDRREFESGAVRDMAEGKGRCDLMPLVDVGEALKMELHHPETISIIFLNLSKCLDSGSDEATRYHSANTAIYWFAGITNMTLPTLMLETAIHYEEGAKKYGEHNWERGLPLWCYIDSATRHLLKYLDGRTDERHDRAFVWNMLGFMYTLRKGSSEDIDYELSKM